MLLLFSRSFAQISGMMCVIQNLLEGHTSVRGFRVDSSFFLGRHSMIHLAAHSSLSLICQSCRAHNVGAARMYVVWRGMNSKLVWMFGHMTSQEELSGE